MSWNPPEGANRIVPYLLFHYFIDLIIYFFLFFYLHKQSKLHKFDVRNGNRIRDSSVRIMNTLFYSICEHRKTTYHKSGSGRNQKDCIMHNLFVIVSMNPIHAQNVQFSVQKARTGQKKSHYPPGNHLLTTSKNVLFPGHNNLLTTGTGMVVTWWIVAFLRCDSTKRLKEWSITWMVHLPESLAMVPAGCHHWLMASPE